MDFGIKIDEKDKKAYCAKCGAHVGNDGKAQMSFCPRCASPLKLEAAKEEEKKIAKEQAIILYELLDRINEGADAITEINNILKELS